MKFAMSMSGLLLALLAGCVSAGQQGVGSAQRDCLALALYWEARGEGERGMRAVGSVVLNRVADERFPSTVCRVVKQGGETPPCQFSWWCDGKSDRPRSATQWKTATTIAQQLIAGKAKDPTKGALFFHNTSVDPKWPYKRTARIGNHVFYKG